QQALRLRARGRIGGPVFELRRAGQRRGRGGRVGGPPRGRRSTDRGPRGGRRPGGRAPRRGRTAGRGATCGITARAWRLQRYLDTVVVVEQGRRRELLVFGQRDHAADRQFGAVAGGANRPEQYEERDRQRGRGEHEEQREL